jgi:hypothetical protein
MFLDDLLSPRQSIVVAVDYGGSLVILDIMKHMSVRINLMNPADWPEVCSIYEEGMATGLGTFDTKAPSWDEWNAARLPHSRLVAETSACSAGLR